MTVQRKVITPSEASKLLDNLFDKQRKFNDRRVGQYARTMRAGNWIDWHPEQYLVDKKSGGLFNGLQRLSAAVMADFTIKAQIDYESDGNTLFATVDAGLPRAPHQFVGGIRAAMRASAARIILWYKFDPENRAMTTLHGYWSLEEVIDVSVSYTPLFDPYIKLADDNYDSTSLSPSIVLAILALAKERGFEEEAEGFAERVANPAGLDPEDPAWYLFSKMSRRGARDRKRRPQQDWAIYTRCMNAAITGDSLPKYFYQGELAPFIGETEKDFTRRIRNAQSRESQKRVRRRASEDAG